jgi:predicted lipid-binding transport protein (Tim44 family)
MTTTTDATTVTAPGATEQFAGKFLGDLAAVLHAGTVVLGDKLGLYRGLVELGPTTPEGLAEHTGWAPRPDRPASAP